MFLAIRVGDGRQHTLEAGSAIVIVGREVGSAVKRLAVGGEKCSQRPSALAGDGTDSDLVAAVDVGTLVTIDFHGDETLVDNGGDLGTVVGFAIHDMTPVAPDGS